MTDYEKPELAGYKKDQFGVYELRVRIKQVIYTYVMESPKVAQDIIRVRDHFNFDHLNKIKEHGRLILKELI